MGQNATFYPVSIVFNCRGRGQGCAFKSTGWMAHRKWIEAKQLPGTGGPGNMLGCCLISFHFLWAIHPIRPVQTGDMKRHP